MHLAASLCLSLPLYVSLSLRSLGLCLSLSLSLCGPLSLSIYLCRSVYVSVSDCISLCICLSLYVAVPISLFLSSASVAASSVLFSFCPTLDVAAVSLCIRLSDTREMREVFDERPIDLLSPFIVPPLLLARILRALSKQTSAHHARRPLGWR